MALHPNDRAALRDFELMLDRTFDNVHSHRRRVAPTDTDARRAVTRLTILWGMETISHDWENDPDPAEEDTGDHLQKRDPFVVDWDGADDPAKPLNWGGRKWVNVGIVSFITFLSSLASSMFAPGISSLMKEFGNSNTLLASFVLSIYVLGYAMGPILLAPLSEIYGRVQIYHATNVLFLLIQVCCAVSQSLGMLIAFRFLAGCAGAAPLTIGGGTIVDLVAVNMRGRVMTIFSMGPLLGPVIGPAIGGVLTQTYGWRATFWALAILSAVTTIAAFIWLSETSAKVLLERKAQSLRKSSGDPQYRSIMATNLPYGKAFSSAIIMPLKLLATQNILLVLSVYMALVYGYLYLFFTTFTNVFTVQYQFSTAVVGLAYGGMGIGFTVGVILMYLTSDRLLAKKTAANNGITKPEFRLPPMVYSSPVLPLGVLLYGWTAQLKLHWVLPQIGTALVGFGLILVLMPLQTYLIDAYTSKAASALAAATILRCLVAAFLPLAGQPMYNALGLGLGNSLLAGIALLMAPLSWWCMVHGENIRVRQRERLG